MSESLTVWTQFNKHVFGLWEEAALPRETPATGHGENIQTLQRIQTEPQIKVKTFFKT